MVVSLLTSNALMNIFTLAVMGLNNTALFYVNHFKACGCPF